MPDDRRLIRVLLVHGWAGSPELWSRFAARLADRVESARVEFTTTGPGYFFRERMGEIDSKEAPGGHFDIAIGHSGGVCGLFDFDSVTLDRIVSIAGFTRFRRGMDFPEGVGARVLERMLPRVEREPGEVLDAFWKNASTDRAGHENFSRPRDAPCSDRLATGLSALQSDDYREQWSQFRGPRLVIAGTDDRIVTARHAAACFPDDRIEWVKTDSHWLPWTFPETCAALVRELIETN